VLRYTHAKMDIFSMKSFTNNAKSMSRVRLSHGPEAAFLAKEFFGHGF
jgi:hypothetical protein